MEREETDRKIRIEDIEVAESLGPPAQYKNLNILSNLSYDTASAILLNSAGVANDFSIQNDNNLLNNVNAAALQEDQSMTLSFDSIHRMMTSKIPSYANHASQCYLTSNEVSDTALTSNSLLNSISSLDSLKALTEMNNSLNRQIESMAVANTTQSLQNYDCLNSNQSSSSIAEYFNTESSFSSRGFTDSPENSRIIQSMEDSSSFPQPTFKLETTPEPPIDVAAKSSMNVQDKSVESHKTAERISNRGLSVTGNTDNARSEGSSSRTAGGVVSLQDIENSESFGESLIKLEVTPDLPYEVSEMDESEVANDESETDLNDENSQQQSPESAFDQSSDSSSSSSNLGSSLCGRTKGILRKSSNSNSETNESAAKPRGTHVDVDRPFKCDICDKRFQKKAYLLNHQKIHDKDCKNECKFCRKRFPTANNLEMHVRTHTGIKPFECDICQKTFIRSDRLQTHMRMHSGIKPFKCDLCEKTFFNANSLKIHARMHTGEKPYECDICEKQFVRADRLQTHLRTHTGEKPFTCDHCGKNFNRADILKTHLRTHTGEKPFECEVCEKRFTQLSTLKGHMLIHTGEKPYGCEICERRFREMSTLRGHYQTHRNR